MNRLFQMSGKEIVISKKDFLYREERISDIGKSISDI
jgi:hypothetical protein